MSSGIEPGKLEFGKFKLRRKLGVGGMAEVFLAEMVGPEGFSRLVALKRILPNLSREEEFIAAFISEARVGGSLIHPNIVSTVELGREGEYFYLAMEYVEGITLGQLIRYCKKITRTPLPLRINLEIIRQVADGLSYAHTATNTSGTPLKLIHRDMKPENVLLSRHGVAKVTDFGIAKAESNLNQTATGIVKGTVAYMSPEQARDLELDCRSDLYSLGSLFYELLTLQRLYPKASGLVGLQRVAIGDVGEQLSCLDSYPSELKAVVAKILARRPEDRHATAKELKKALEKVWEEAPPAPMGLDTVVQDVMDTIALQREAKRWSAPISRGASTGAESVAEGGAANGSEGTPAVLVGGRLADAGNHDPTVLPWAGQNPKTGEDPRISQPVDPPSNNLAEIAGEVETKVNAEAESGDGSSVVQVEGGASSGGLSGPTGQAQAADPSEAVSKQLGPIDSAVAHGYARDLEHPGRTRSLAIAAVLLTLVGIGALAVFSDTQEEPSVAQISSSESQGEVAEAGASRSQADPADDGPASGHAVSTSAQSIGSEGNGEASAEIQAEDIGSPAVREEAGAVGSSSGNVPAGREGAQGGSGPAGRGLVDARAVKEKVASNPATDDLGAPATQKPRKTTPSRPTCTQLFSPGLGKAGFLSINAVPYAFVYLDGCKAPETTPLFKQPVWPGRYKLKLETSDGRTHTIGHSVVIKKGQGTKEDTVKF